MPIYEFFCPDCNTVFSFYSPTVNTRKIPLCVLIASKGNWKGSYPPFLPRFQAKKKQKKTKIFPLVKQKL